MPKTQRDLECELENHNQTKKQVTEELHDSKQKVDHEDDEDVNYDGPANGETTRETLVAIIKPVKTSTPLYVRSFYLHDDAYIPCIMHTWQLPVPWDSKIENSKWWKRDDSFHVFKDLVIDRDLIREMNYCGDSNSFEASYRFCDKSGDGFILPPNQVTELQTVYEIDAKIKKLEETLVFYNGMVDLFGLPIKNACDGEIVMMEVPCENMKVY
jgi:hypothetical protein